MRKIPLHLHFRRCCGTLLGASLLAGPSLRADLIDQTINQNTLTEPTSPIGWSGAIWGTPANFANFANEYRIPSGFLVRTPNYATNTTFLGAKLYNTNGGTLSLKHGNGTATVNLVLGPGSLVQNQGPGGITNCPVAGTLEVAANANISAGTGVGPRHILLRSTLTGAGNLTVAMNTNVLYLAGDASGYSGNWTCSGGRMEVWPGGANSLGSGTVTLVNAGNTLTFATTSNLVIPNAISGAGGVIQAGSGGLLLTGLNSFSGALTVRGGTLLLPGADFGTQGSTLVTSTGVLRVANSSPLGYSPLTVDGNNAMTARLELSNNVTLQTFNGLTVTMRNNATPAIVSVSGNNTIADTLQVSSGGGQLYVEANAGTTLELSGGVTSIATGARNFTLQGEGNGLVSGTIQNGSASALSVNKSGPGTWTLTQYNTHTGNTTVNAGVLRLGVGGSISSSPIIQVAAGATLDSAPAGGLALGSAFVPQTLRGLGAVLGDVSTANGSGLDVGLAGQVGSLNLSNHLVLTGSDFLRFDLASSSNDVLNVTGNLVLQGTTTNQIAVIGGLVENGTYRLINYTGSLQGGGSFLLVPPASRQSFSLDLSTPHQINLVVTGNPASLTWSGDGVFNLWDVGASLNWNTGTEVFYQSDNVTFNDTGSATPAIAIVQPVQAGSMVINNPTKDYTFSDTNGITTAGSLTKQGAGLAAFANGGNAFSGPISVEAGTLQIGNGDTNGSLGNGAISLATGTMLAHDKTNNLGTSLNGIISGEGGLRVKSGSLQLFGSNTFSGPVNVEYGDLTIRNPHSLGDPATGTTVLPGGSVRIQSLGNWVIAEPLTLSGSGYTNAWLNFPGALYVNTVSNRVVWTGPITLAGETLIRAVNDYLLLTLSNHVTAAGHPLTVSAEGTGNRVVAAGNVSIGDEVVLTKNGSGTLVLAGPANLAGGTVINAGAVALASPNAPDIGDVTVNGGTLAIGDGGAEASFPLGLINLVNPASRLALNTTTDLTLTREIFGAGSLAKQNANTVTLTLSNSFAGNVTTGSGAPGPNGTGAGIIRLLNSHGLGNEINPKTVQLVRSELQLEGGLTIPSAITFETSGGAFVVPPGEGPGLIPIRSRSGNNVIEGGIRLIGGAGGSEIAVDAGTLTIAGAISDQTTSARDLYLSGAGNGVANGAINTGTFGITLRKQGPGTWTLNSQNFYTGSTLIEGGTLTLGPDATLSATPVIELRNNSVFNVAAIPGGFPLALVQTLRGNGTIQGSVVANGQVQPGTSVGTLNVTGSISLNSAVTMELDRSGSQKSDLLAASSIVCVDWLSVVNIGPALQGGEVFNLFDGAISGQFLGVTLPNLDYNPALAWDTSELYTTGVIKVTGGLPPTPGVGGPSLVDGNLVFQVPSEAGYTYILEATPNLIPANWSGIQTNAGGSNLNYSIPVNPALPAQFFRMRVQ
jgi:fibronectin-binding autotransporter adhesin